MAISSVVDMAVQNFFMVMGDEFMPDIAGSKYFDHHITSVEQIVDLWLQSGHATSACAEEFHIFLSAVALIFAYWQHVRFVTARDESEYDDECFIPWRITQALKDAKGSEVATDIFDPYSFQLRVSIDRETRDSRYVQRILDSRS